MKKCFKLLGLVLLATTLTMSLASCGGDDDDDSTTTTTTDPGDDPEPPGPGPNPPDENPFEGMTEGTVKVNFQGADTVLEFASFKYYAELAGSGGIVALNYCGAKADAGNGQIYLPYTRVVADLTTDQALNPYLTWYMSRGCGGWKNLIVTYQTGDKDTFEVGDYFYGGATSCGPITVSNFSYQGLRKQLTAKVQVTMVNFDDATGGVETPRTEVVTYYFYKFVTDNAYPQSKSISDKKGILKSKDKIPVSYSRL